MALFPLGITVELLINGAWTDISSYVRQRTTMQITGGQSQKADTSQPAQLTMELDNRDNRFSPYNTAGAFYPFLKRNVQVRVSVNDTSSSGNNYSGYRYWGEIHRWPPVNDLSGRDVTVNVTASGPLRRLRAHGGKGSALTRYYNTLTGSYAPIAYWPCEEDPDTTIIGAGIDGGTTMSVTTGTPKWKHISDFNGSSPIGVVNRSTWDGLTGSFGSSGSDTYNTPGTYTWVASTSTVTCSAFGPAGLGGSCLLSNNNGSGGGGGGEYAKETAAAVTPGTGYTFTIPAGGSGTATAVTLDAVTVTAHAGGNGGNASAGSPGTAGAAGTGSANATHFNGGAGAAGTSSRGGGGGSSAGTAGAGNNASGGTGGAAPTGGFAGGSVNAGQGITPGGGGAGRVLTSGTFQSGGPAGAGQVNFSYTPASVPAWNVVRWIALHPKHGANPSKIILDVETGGTIKSLRVNYVAGGKLQLKGYSGANGTGSNLFDSTAQSWGVDGQTIMVSIELTNSGANVAWAFKAIVPGSSTLLGSVSGTVTTASVGNVSEVIVSPNADITKTAIGHISVQYALVSLRKVSNALNGHNTEMGIDRFIRLANEQALSNIPEFNETADHWGFETGTQSWTATSGALTNPTTTFTPVDTDTTPNLTIYPLLTQAQAWPPDGTHSLLLTCNGSANPAATSPTGTSGQPVSVGDIVSVNAEVYCPAAKNNIFIGLVWYTSGGTLVSESDAADVAFAAGEMKTLRHTFTAPATAAFFAVKIGDHETPANGQLIYIDNVRVHPRMGPQTRKELHKFLEEIAELDQGLLKEAKELWGLKYRTRIKLINQTPAVTLDYSAGTLSPPLAPVVDDRDIKNDVTIHRHKGSKVHVTHATGDTGTAEPPAGAGRHKHRARIAAERDEQLAAHAAHLLTLGTVSTERFPTITVNLARAGILNNAVAPLMSAIAGVEIGDYVQLTNLPAWFPSTTAKQLVIGYTETLNAYEWTITWNCTPELGFEIISTNLRRW